MKIILTADVAGLGESGDIVEVKPGYARNYLMPQEKAIMATPGAEKQVHNLRRVQESRRVRNLENAQSLREQLQELGDVKLIAKVSPKGKLFGSVTAADVAKAVREAGGPTLDRRTLNPREHMKSLGKYTVDVNLHPDVKTTLRVEVTTGK